MKLLRVRGYVFGASMRRNPSIFMGVGVYVRVDRPMPTRGWYYAFSAELLTLQVLVYLDCPPPIVPPASTFNP
jgi:hypothetical protein